MILADDKNNSKELEKAKEILEKAGINVTRTFEYKDNFASTRWSIDDAGSIDELSMLSNENKIAFLEFAEEQIKGDMIERGWESLKVLADIFLSDEFDINTEPHCYDLIKIHEDTGEEEFIDRYFDTTPNDLAKMLAENLDEEDWELEEDDDMNYWFYFRNEKDNELHRIQLFQ